MLEAACNYIRTNKSGRTDIWICSDIRENDWDPESGRWPAVRQSFLALRQGIRFHLLAYPEAATGNVSVRVSDVRRQQNGDAAELVLSLRLVREGGDGSRTSVPVHFEIDGARSELTVEMDKNQYDLKEYRIPLESRHERGWGKVTIPADVNPADNDYYFAFERPVPRRAVIVADDSQAARPLQLAAAITPDPALQCSADVVAADQLATLEWEKVSLLLWQAPLPEGDAARPVRDFVDRGGFAIFLPPKVPGQHEFFGTRWKTWVDSATNEPSGNEMTVENWRGDQDLLAHTQSGAMLPVGQLRIRRYCGLSGDFTPLATLRGGAPLFAVRRQTGGRLESWGRLLPRDHARSGRFFAGDQRHRALRARATGPRRRCRRLGQRPATDSRRKPRQRERNVAARRRVRTGAFHRVSLSSWRLRGRRPAARRQSPPRRRSGSDSRRRPRGRLVPRARFHSRRPPGGSNRDIDPGNLETVSSVHDRRAPASRPAFASPERHRTAGDAP